MRFDFAISFARPERDLARVLARELTARGLSVFFDEGFEHEMLGQDGADYLNRVFLRESRFCVALISRGYEQRSWTQLERRAAQARELQTGPGFLLPIRVDDSLPEWLLPTRIYFDLPSRGLSALVEVLARKATLEGTVASATQPRPSRAITYWHPVPAEPPFIPLAYPVLQEIASGILQGHTLTYLQGPPGAGKSALINALPAILRDAAGHEWHVARVTSELTQGSVLAALAEFGATAGPNPGVIVLDEAYDTDCRLTGDGLRRSLEVLLNELPKTSMSGTAVVTSARSSTELPSELLLGSQTVDLARRGMVLPQQVCEFLAQCQGVIGDVTAEEVAWVQHAFFGDLTRLEPLHLHAYALYRSTTSDYRSFQPGRDAAKLYEDNVFARLPAAQQLIWSLVALLGSTFRQSLWQGPLPEWLLREAWALAGERAEDFPRAEQAILKSRLLTASLTADGRRALSFSHDAYAELPVLATRMSELISRSGATDAGDYRRRLSRVVERRVLGITRRIADRSAVDPQEALDDALSGYLVRAGLGHDAWPDFFRGDAFSQALDRSLLEEGDLLPMTRLVYTLTDWCRDLLDTASEPSAFADEKVARAASLLRAMMELRAAATPAGARLQLGYDPRVSGTFGFVSQRLLFQRMVYPQQPAAQFAPLRPLPPLLAQPAGPAEHDLLRCWHLMQAVVQDHALLWGHVRNDPGADLVGRYTHLLSEGDLYVGDDPDEAAAWYRRGAEFAAERGYSLLELAALFCCVKGFLQHKRKDEFCQALEACFALSVRVCGRPAWFEVQCGLLAGEIGAVPGPTTALQIRAGEEFASATAARPGASVLLLPSLVLLVPAALLAARLTEFSPLPVRLEVAYRPWLPEQIQATGATSVVDFGSALTPGAGLIRRYTPASDWYPWTRDDATATTRFVYRVVADQFRFCHIGGYGTASVALSAQEAADDIGLLRWLCGE